MSENELVMSSQRLIFLLRLGNDESGIVIPVGCGAKAVVRHNGEEIDITDETPIVIKWENPLL